MTVAVALVAIGSLAIGILAVFLLARYERSEYRRRPREDLIHLEQDREQLERTIEGDHPLRQTARVVSKEGNDE